MNESKFPPDISFLKLSPLTSSIVLEHHIDAYIIDGGTIRDLLLAVDPKTASQAYRRAILLEILEQNTSLGGGAEKKS